MLVDMCNDAGFLLRIIVKIVKYMHIIIPIILVVMASIDLFKVVVGQADEKAKKEATDKIVKRVLYAAIIFLIPTIVSIIFKKIEGPTNTSNNATNTTSTSWISCWNYYYNQ